MPVCNGHRGRIHDHLFTVDICHVHPKLHIAGYAAITDHNIFAVLMISASERLKYLFRAAYQNTVIIDHRKRAEIHAFSVAYYTVELSVIIHAPVP